jgi:tricorn protease
MTSGYYRFPTIHDDRVVFVSEDDLWEVAVDGGRARRLTANPGPSSYPSFSPDGSRIAYTGRDEGMTEVHVMDADGGAPTRLTFHGALSQVLGWDGDEVIYASNAEWPFSNDFRLWAVAALGGPPRMLPWGPARSLAREPDGPGLLLGRQTMDPARWKRYRGGRAGSVWVDRRGTGEFTRLLKVDGNLASPMWLGRRIYFISDHEGYGNIYSATPTGRSLQRHTNHTDFYARHAATDGRRIVYHVGADLWLLDPEAPATIRVEVELPSARPHRNRRFISPGNYIESYDLHPEGHSLAANVRGGTYTMPLWEGSVVRHGPVSSVRRRLGTWMPDGERVVSVTDETGEERLVVEHVGGPGKAKTPSPRLIDVDLGRVRSLDVAPGGDERVAVTNHRHELLLVSLDTGKARQVHRSPHSWIAGTAWSADGRWLAFAAATTRTSQTLFLLDTNGRGDPVALGRPEFDDRWPSFDPGGRFLYFTSARVFDPVADSHFHEYAFPTGTRAHLVTLRSDIGSPFDPEARPPRAPGAPPGGAPKPPDGQNGDDSGTPEAIDIDLEGIETRVVAFPQSPGRYGRVVGAKGRVFTVSYPISGSLTEGDDKPTGRLEAWDFNTEKIEAIAEGVSGVASNPSGTVVLIGAGKRVRVVPVGWKDDKSPAAEANRTTGWVDLNRIRAQIDPGREWRQMFSEAWRLQRDYYWHEDMAGIDWSEVHDRYLPLVDRVGSRAEFSDLMWEMQGELGTSHAYELGGDYRPVPNFRQGSLGADLELTRGRWVVRTIVEGDAWDPAARSPLAAPGVDVASGDRLLAIDGVEVDPARSPDELLVDRGGRPVQVTVKRGRKAAHTATIKPLVDEALLRYRSWVEANRALVAERTDGRAGYLHIPDMGPRGFAEFHRALLTEVDKDGLVVDVRFNRGGNVSQLLLEKLARRRLGWGVSRWNEPEPFPRDSPSGPMVCLTDEMSGSDGDIFSHTFKLLGLGPLIGTRTWGGVVGIWPQQSLVDGTVTTQPEYGHWFDDVGFSVENYGTDPDIEVVIRPQDHAAGRDPQMERGLTELSKLMKSHRPSAPDVTTRVSLVPPLLEQ